MRQSYKLAAGVVASLGLGIAVATAYASPGQMGAGMEHGKGGMQHGMAEGMQHGKGGMQHGAKEGMRHGKGGEQHGAKEGMRHGKGGEQRGAHRGQESARDHGAGHGAGLMAPEERTALREKMRNATPEERQQIAAATRAEMRKRAQEKGVTPREGHGPRSGAAPGAPETTEHQH